MARGFLLFLRPVCCRLTPSVWSHPLVCVDPAQSWCVRFKKERMKSKKAFRRWLITQFDEIEAICEFGQPDFYDRLDITGTVDQACRYASRLGGGDLIGDEIPIATPRQALVVIGRLLAWSVRPDHPPDLLSVNQVSDKLGLSVRSVWRMSSDGNLPKPIAVSGRSLWREGDIAAMIDLSLSRK